MSSQPTAKDAELLIKIYEIGHSTEMKKKYTWALMLIELTPLEKLEALKIAENQSVYRMS